MDEQYIVPALRRGLSILRLFNRDRRTISLPEITRELDLPRGTAFRLVYTLEAEGYLQRAAHSNSFQLALGVLSLGFEYVGSLDIVDIAKPVLERLRDETDASTHLAVPDGWDVAYLVSIPSRHRISGNLTVGTRLSADQSSIGHTLLFGRSVEELMDLARAGGVALDEEEARALHRSIASEAASGYVLFRGIYVPGIDSVAAPVRDASGRVVAGINVSDYETVPCFGDADGALARAVMDAAGQISRGLGHR